MTEIGGVATCQLQCHKVGSCGTPIRNTQIKIVDPDNGNVLGPNQTGELWMKSDNMMNGYYKNPEATKNTVDEEGNEVFFFCILTIFLVIIDYSDYTVDKY